MTGTRGAARLSRRVACTELFRRRGSGARAGRWRLFYSQLASSAQNHSLPWIRGLMRKGDQKMRPVQRGRLAAAQALCVWAAVADTAVASCSADNDCASCIQQKDWSGSWCSYCASSGKCSASIVATCSSSWKKSCPAPPPPPLHTEGWVYGAAGKSCAEVCGWGCEAETGDSTPHAVANWPTLTQAEIEAITGCSGSYTSSDGSASPYVSDEGHCSFQQTRRTAPARVRRGLATLAGCVGANTTPRSQVSPRAEDRCATSPVLASGIQTVSVIHLGRAQGVYHLRAS